MFIFILCFFALPSFLSTIGPKSTHQKSGAIGSEKDEKNAEKAPWEEEYQDNDNDNMEYEPPKNIQKPDVNYQP